MNILYYGANNTINDQFINTTLYNQTRTYKNIKYFENSQYLTFPIINIHILQFIKSLIQTTTINNIIRKIILFNIEQLDQESMTILRIILEKYNNTTAFIATTTQRSKIDIEITPITKIITKPTLADIKKIVKKCRKYSIKDISLELLKITPYKLQFIEHATNIEHQHCFHNNKELAIETLFLVCFYPPKYDIKKNK